MAVPDNHKGMLYLDYESLRRVFHPTVIAFWPEEFGRSSRVTFSPTFIKAYCYRLSMWKLATSADVKWGTSVIEKFVNLACDSNLSLTETWIEAFREEGYF